MRVLLDTHTFLWYLDRADQLSRGAEGLIESDETDVFLSIASLWEISIKSSRGKLVIADGYESLPEVLTRYAIEIVPISFEHTVKQIQLTFHHKDPFDRMIAAQALVEKIDLISVDPVFDAYFQGSGVNRIW